MGFLLSGQLYLGKSFILFKVTSRISPTSIDNDTATNVTITGTNFANGARVEYLASDGDIFQPNSVSFTSATQLVVNITEDTAGTYFLRVENPNGQAVRTGSAVLTVDS